MKPSTSLEGDHHYYKDDDDQNINISKTVVVVSNPFRDDSRGPPTKLLTQIRRCSNSFCCISTS